MFFHIKAGTQWSRYVIFVNIAKREIYFTVNACGLIFLNLYVKPTWR